MPFKNGYALTIGVGEYQNMSQYNVPIAAKDAAAVTATLQDPALCGYPQQQITHLYNEEATRQKVLNTLDELAGKLTPEDTLFLFYVGHGVYGSDGNYHLTTHDTQLQNRQVLPGTGLSEVELLDKLSRVQAKRIILAINACHSGELSPSFDIGDAALSSEPPPQKLGEALLSSGEGRIIITACRPGQKSWVGLGSLSIFSQALISGLKGEARNSHGYISAFGLYEYVFFAAKEAAENLGQEQEPELTVLKGVGPFPVALYHGASAPASFDSAEPAPAGTAAREVSAEKSRRVYQHYQASFSGSGALAQGSGAKAVGQGGVMIDVPGKVGGSIVVGDGNTVE